MRSHYKNVYKIQNRKNHFMYIILSSKSKILQDKNILLIFCQAGLAIKTGVGNQFKSMCDNLLDLCNVLRFDQTCTGDSDGDINEEISINSYFSRVMHGCYIEDTVDVINWATNKFPNIKIILMGQCGGCLTGAYVGNILPEKIDAYIFLAPPVLYINNNDSTILRDFDALQIFSNYFKKVFNYKSYINLMRGNSNFYLIYNSFYATFLYFFRKKIIKNHLHPNFNNEFYNCFNKIYKNKKILILLPQLDNETSDFMSYFYPKIINSIFINNVTILNLVDCDHSVMFDKPRSALNNVLYKWIQDTFDLK